MLKRCSKCKEEKPRSEFNKLAQAKDGLCGRCRVCDAERTRKYRETNSGARYEYNRKWKQAHPCAVRQHNTRWRARNPEVKKLKDRKWQQANPEKAQIRNRKWANANPDKVNARASTRRARKRLATVNPEGLAMMYHAASLATARTGIQWHVDHMKALANGGEHGAHNLQLLPDWLNLPKGAKDHTEFINTNHLYSAWSMLSAMFPVQMPSLMKIIETKFQGVSASYQYSLTT